MPKLRVSDFETWKDYYWTYQQELTHKFLIPYLQREGLNIEGKKILEIGCGDGGVIASMAVPAQKAVGIELKQIDFTGARDDHVLFLNGDIFDEALLPKYEDQYDLVVLRDVIEHIPNTLKGRLLEKIKSLMHPNGRLLVTYPPYYSAFGAHQQVYSSSWLTRLPYIHVVTGPFYRRLVKRMERQNQKAIDLADEILIARTSIRSLRKHIRKSPLVVRNSTYFLVRPSHELRYGIKARVSRILPYMPILREFLISGVYMILTPKPDEDAYAPTTDQ